MARPAIGYVTSGAYATFKVKFLEGLSSTNNPDGNPWQGEGAGRNVDIKLGEATGDYDAKNTKQTLNKHIARLSNDPDIRLIVAVGGLVSAFAAARHSTKPFIVMIGQLPATDDFDLDPDSNFNFYGGINLGTTSANTARHTAARTLANCKPEEVFLVFNNNARMARAERRNWKAHGWPAIASAGEAEDNDVDNFKKCLQKAKNKFGAKALVISADPFFAAKRDELVGAINDAGIALPVCYPSKHFTGATPAPTPNSFKWLGPDLDEEYKNIGRKAGTLLTKILAGNIEFVGLDTAATLGPLP